ncbi:hypothetical protein QBC32DRAFT_241246 [Pseudoneurospora amorphoporcata]|uniref:Zn(2)-C6 fungal-type domain-containing protein n=1 Tax=Pseudoneurospora amorphoporcata TaxID=241081 RepID=A0AAN6NUR7_9PEZI|nr:hypothetical protein QBC32DRAFT_241246 [Pseudoneurospora amorphoporcata]
MADPMDGSESTPAPALPAAQQSSGHSGGPLPPITSMPMPPMPSVSAPPPAPATINFNLNPLTPPAHYSFAAAHPVNPAFHVSSAPSPPPQLPPIASFHYQDQYHQQSPHQQSTPWQPAPVSGLTPTTTTSLVLHQPSSSSAHTPSPTTPVFAALNATPQPPPTLPGPASLLKSSYNNPYIPITTTSPASSTAIPSATAVPSSGRQQGAQQGAKDAKDENKKRRNRPAVSCVPCRQRKIRCDQQRPACGACVKYKFHRGSCVYDQKRLPKDKTWPLKATQIDSREASPEPEPTYLAVPQNARGAPDGMANAQGGTLLTAARNGYHARYRERDYPSVSAGAYGGRSATPQLPPSETEPGASPAFSPISHAQHSGGPLAQSDVGMEYEALRRENLMLRQQLVEKYEREEQQQQQQPQLPPGRGLLLEIRPGSQNGAPKTGWHAKQLFPLVTKASYKALHGKDDQNNAWSNLKTCTRLVRKLEKSQSRILAPLGVSDLGGNLPMSYRQDAQRLTEAYFRTFESVYRILHVPDFWKRFREYFDGRLDKQFQRAFIIQLQLCMAIGAVFEDVGGLLRRHQERWIQEGQSWLSQVPSTKLAGLQTMCLLHLANEVCGFGGGGGELTYNSAGSLLREALCLGLNRDPHASTPIYEAELCRRLWATILELVVQSSLNTGLPPGISVTDFDTSPPANYDDEQLALPNPVPRPSKTFTQTTVLLAIHRSFSVRLTVAQHVATLRLNSSKTEAPAVESGQTTESLSVELRDAMYELRRTLETGYDRARILPDRISVFQLKMADMLVNRFFLGLNLALVKPSEVEMPEVRKSCGAAANAICRDVVSGWGKARVTGRSSGGGAVQHQQMDDFTSLVSRGSGTSYHATAMAAVLVFQVELRRQLEEEWQKRRSRSGPQHDTPLPPINRQGHLDHRASSAGLAGSEANSPPGGSTSTASASNRSGVEQDVAADEAISQELLELVSSAVDWTFGRIQTANAGTGTSVWICLLCSAAMEELRALQRRLETQLQQRKGSSTSLAERNMMEREEEEQGKDVEQVTRRIVNDLNRLVEVLTTRVQQDGDPAALAGRAADERSLELERVTEREEHSVMRFESIFDLRNYASLFVPEWMD